MSFDHFTYRVALDHKFGRNILAYVSYNTGFKSGGYNLNAADNPPYKPETLGAVEGGFKSELLDRRLRLNIAAYDYDYSNIQVSEFINSTLSIANGAKAKMYVADFDADYALGYGVSLTGGLAYIHDRFESYPDALYYPGFGGCSAPLGSQCVESAAGKELPVTPTLTYNLGASYTTEIYNGKFASNIIYDYSARWYAAPDNYVYQPSYGIVNASVSWTDPSDRYTVRLWGKNIANQVYATGVFETQGGVYRSLAAPRQYGVTVGAKF